MSQKNVTAPGFHHIALRARDFDRSVKFYTEAIGFTPAYSWGEGDERGVMLDVGDGNFLELFAGGQLAPGEDYPEGAYFHYALRSADPDAAYARAIAAGARPSVEPKDVIVPGEPPLHLRIAFVKGPDGESIEFFKNDRL